MSQTEQSTEQSTEQQSVEQQSTEQQSTEQSVPQAHTGRVKWFNNTRGYGFLTYKDENGVCLLYTSPSPRDLSTSRMPSSA